MMRMFLGVLGIALLIPALGAAQQKPSQNAQPQ